MKLPARALPGLLALLLASQPQADTLKDIYELALENDAQLKSEEAQYRAGLETERLSRSALLPQVNANYDFTNTDTDTDSESVGSDFQPTEVSSNVDVDREGYQVSLNQAIFDLPAWFSFQAGKESSKEAEATFAANQQDLIVRVVESYLGVLRAQDNLEASQARERAFKRQLEQTQQRFEVGLIAITDVHEAQAAYDLAQVDRIVDENNVNVALERLSVLTGRYHSNLYLLAPDFKIQPPTPNVRSDWVEFALKNNFRLAAATYREEAARQNARANKWEHAPRVSGQVAYSDYETDGTRSQDPPGLLDLSPDQEQEQELYQLRVDVPLYSGGAISSNRRRTAQEYISARESRINLMRNTVTNTRSLHMTVISDVSRVKARAQSIVSSQSALDATTAGYEVGTRNIVDVLDAQNVLFAAKRDYANARYDYVIDILRLKEQAGLLSPEDVYRLMEHLPGRAGGTHDHHPQFQLALPHQVGQARAHPPMAFNPPLDLEAVKGFLAVDEAEALYNAASDVAGRGPVLEIGSYCGKSTICLGLACAERDSVVYALDHHRGSEEHQRGEMFHDPELFDEGADEVDTFREFRHNIRAAGVEQVVVPVVAGSELASKAWQTPLAMVFIDGGHSLDAALTDYRCWSGHLLRGGILAIHDVFPDAHAGGQAPYAIYQMALASNLFEEIERVNTLALLRRL